MYLVNIKSVTLRETISLSVKEIGEAWLNLKRLLELGRSMRSPSLTKERRVLWQLQNCPWTAKGVAGWRWPQLKFDWPLSCRLSLTVENLLRSFIFKAFLKNTMCLKTEKMSKYIQRYVSLLKVLKPTVNLPTPAVNDLHSLSYIFPLNTISRWWWCVCVVRGLAQLQHEWHWVPPGICIMKGEVALIVYIL